MTDNWNDKIEQTLKEIETSCTGYKWMNIFASRKNDRKYNFLMYSSIAVSPIAGILSTFSEGTGTIQTLVTVFSFLGGVISAVIKFSEFGEKSLSYKSTASRYASLENNIKRQLSLDRINRPHAEEYLEFITTTFDEIFSSSPLVSDEIYQEWVEYAKINNITVQKELTAVTVKPVVESDMSGKMRYEMNRLYRMK